MAARQGRRREVLGHGKVGGNAGTAEPSSSFPAFCLCCLPDRDGNTVMYSMNWVDV